MDGSRRWRKWVLIALAGPVVVVLMIPLAVLAALAFYLVAIVKGFWTLCCGVPGWVLAHEGKARPGRPHFLDLSALKNHLD